jgi:hypothetical protein
MGESRVLFSGLKLLLPADWCDVTEDLGSGVPATLARSGDSVGGLQLSVAHYRAGVYPKITIEHLRDLLTNLFNTRSLGEPLNLVEWCNCERMFAVIIERATISTGSGTSAMDQVWPS